MEEKKSLVPVTDEELLVEERKVWTEEGGVGSRRLTEVENLNIYRAILLLYCSSATK